MKKEIKKAPHYFLVHFTESFTSVDKGNVSGKAYVIICDGVPTNVYGFKSEEEAKSFDPLKLRTLLRGSRYKKELWSSLNEETLIQEINADQRIKDGVYQLNHDRKGGAIENLPECQRMHVDSKGALLCGKPENKYGDGCCGGCVLQGYDQEEEFYDGFRCPMYAYWEKSFAKKEEVF